MTYSHIPTTTYASGGRQTTAANPPTYREQILDSIAYVQGIETPILNVARKEDIYNTIFGFVMGHIQFDRTAIPADGEGKIHDGAGHAGQTHNRIRAQNGIHIHSKDIAVTDVTRKMREVGAPDEYQHQVWEEARALAVEFENILIWSEYQQGQDNTAWPASGQPPKTHGLFSWARTTGLTATPTIAGVVIPQTYSSTYFTGSGVDMTRRQFNEQLIQPAWEAGMEIDRSLFFVGTKVKRVISGYAMSFQGSGATLTATPLNERNIPAEAAMLNDKLDIYEGDWGRFFAIKNRNMANTTAFTMGNPTGSVVPAESILGFEPRYIGIGVFEGINHIPLAKQGSGSVGYVEAIMGIIVRNPRAMLAGHALAA